MELPYTFENDTFYCSKVIGIGKTLLKKVNFDEITKLGSMAFPLRERCRLESCFVSFSI